MREFKFLGETLSHPDHNLQSRNLPDCSFTIKCCQEFAPALKLNHVKILDDGENDVQDDGRAVQVQKCPNCVETLGLERCNLMPDCCQQLTSVL